MAGEGAAWPGRGQGGRGEAIARPYAAAGAIGAPFRPPIEYDGGAMEKSPPRTALVLAICAALGATGFTLGLAGALAAADPVIPAGDPPAIPLPPAPPGEEAAWEALDTAWRRMPAVQAEKLRDRAAALGALAAVNVVASGVLLFGAIAARLRRARGLAALRTGLALSQGYALLAAIVQTAVQVEITAAQREVLAPLARLGGTAAAMAHGAWLTWIAVVGTTALVALVQLGFFFWAQRWTRRPEVQAALSPPARV